MLQDNQKKGRWNIKSIAGTIAVMSVIVAPFMSSDDDNIHVATRDASGRPSICFGHTKNVKMTDKATDDQCQRYYEEDMTEAIAFVIKQSPSILEHKSALKAAGHFTLGSGPQAYIDSPMLIHFKNKDWVKGCHAFTGYDVNRRYKIRKFGSPCTKLDDGTWSCTLKSLQDLRNTESKICLGKT